MGIGYDFAGCFVCGRTLARERMWSEAFSMETTTQPETRRLYFQTRESGDPAETVVPHWVGAVGICRECATRLQTRQGEATNG